MRQLRVVHLQAQATCPRATSASVQSVRAEGQVGLASGRVVRTLAVELPRGARIGASNLPQGNSAVVHPEKVGVLFGVAASTL